MGSIILLFASVDLLWKAVSQLSSLIQCPWTVVVYLFTRPRLTVMQRRIRFSYTKEYYIWKKENYVCPKITLQDIAYNDKSKVKPAIGVEGTQVM